MVEAWKGWKGWKGWQGRKGLGVTCGHLGPTGPMRTAVYIIGSSSLVVQRLMAGRKPSVVISP